MLWWQVVILVAACAALAVSSFSSSKYYEDTALNKLEAELNALKTTLKGSLEDNLQKSFPEADKSFRDTLVIAIVSTEKLLPKSFNEIVELIFDRAASVPVRNSFLRALMSSNVLTKYWCEYAVSH